MKKPSAFSSPSLDTPSLTAPPISTGNLQDEEDKGFKSTRRLAIAAPFALASFASSAAFAAESEQEDEQDNSRARAAGVVFAMSNATAANRIFVYRRSDDGQLTRVGNVRTRGLGIGTDLDTQGGLRLGPDNRFLYAVNAGSDDISVFAVDGTHLNFVQKIYAGDEPLSLTLHGDLLYVLNGSVAGNGIRGFKVASNGRLTALPDSFRALSSPIAVPGDIEFSPDGKFLLVPHKTTNVLLTPMNTIDGFTIGSDGYASAMPVANASFGLRPFSLAFRNDGKVIVVESFNAAPNRSAASSYNSFPDARINVISGSVPNSQTDTCWVVVSKDQRFAFTANFGSGTISSYRIAESSGALSLIAGVAASTGATSQPVDLALSADGRFLFLLLRGLGGVASFRIEANGALTPRGIVVGGLPVDDGASGLASY